MIRQRADVGIVPFCAWALLQDFHDLRWRSSVRFRKDDIEGDSGGARLPQNICKSRDVCSRPRPLAEAIDTLVVDVNDLDGCLLIGPRRRTLVKVEEKIACFDDRLGLERVQQQHSRRDQESGKRSGRDAVARARRDSFCLIHQILRSL